MLWFAALLGLAAGFALGRARLDTLVNWAEDWTSPGWRTWRFWPALPVAIAVLILMWIVRPRRTLANIRSWRAGERLHPAPQYDPHWPSGRVECGVSVQDWWCRLPPAHSGGCVPRRTEEAS